MKSILNPLHDGRLDNMLRHPVYRSWNDIDTAGSSKILASPSSSADATGGLQDLLHINPALEDRGSGRLEP